MGVDRGRPTRMDCSILGWSAAGLPEEQCFLNVGVCARNTGRRVEELGCGLCLTCDNHMLMLKGMDPCGKKISYESEATLSPCHRPASLQVW